jgi:hypothetical protein
MGDAEGALRLIAKADKTAVFAMRHDKSATSLKPQRR